MLNGKNKSFNIADKILCVVLALLLGLYIVSFTKSCSSTDKREIVKSALVNKKYADKITMFQLQGQRDIITISKKGNNWFITAPENPNVTIPASNEKIASFINDLISVQEMYKLSDKIEKNSAFGLTDSSAFYIRYYYDDKFNDIIFGNQDFALSSRYMMSGKSTAVYEITNLYDKYLTPSVQLWAEPFIISQQILGEITPQDVQRCLVTYEGTTKKIDFPEKILELRHGGLPTAKYFYDNMFEKPLYEMKLELGNKNAVNLKIVKSDKTTDQEYFVATEYFENDKSKYISYSKISGWTYNKIKEVTL